MGILPAELDGVIDPDALVAWLDAQGLPGSGLDDAALLPGGTQNILLRFTRGGRPYVLRRGPRHLRPKSNDQLRREMQVLAALAGTDVPHPALIAACPEEGVLGDAVFYVMEAIDGFNPTVELPALHRDDASVRHAMGLAIVDGAAARGGVDRVAVGRGAVGKVDGSLERRVPRGLAELQSYDRHDGYPGPDIPGLEAVATWLDANRPAT